MAKFKRFDPRNKQASREKYLSIKEQRRDKLTHRIIASEKNRKHNDNDKAVYTLEEETEL